MARDTLAFLPAKLVEGAIGMAMISLYTDLFSIPAYNDYQIINTTVLFVYLFGLGWLLNAAVRYVGDSAKDKGKEKVFYTTVAVCYLAVVAVLAVVSLGIYAVTRDPVFPAGAAMFASYGLFQIMNGILVQAGKVKASVILSLSAATVKLAGAYLYTALLPGGASTPYPAVAAAVTADLAAGLIAAGVLGLYRNFQVSLFSKERYLDFLRFGMPLVGFSVSVGFLNMSDRYIVSFMAGKAAFAAYSANYSVSSGLFTLVMAGIMRGVYPAVLKGWREGGPVAAGPLLNRGVRLYILLALPAAAGLFAVGPRLSEVFFTKPEYHVGIVIGIAAFAMFFMGLTEYTNKVWELTANTVPVLQNSLFAAAVKIGATFALLPRFGIVGAAVASLLAFVSYFVLARVRAGRELVFHVPGRSLRAIVLAAAVCVAAARLVLGMTTGVLSLVLAVGAGAAAYVLTLALTGEIKEELSAAAAFFKARRG